MRVLDTQRTCVVCGAVFVPKHSNTTLCGKKECDAERKRQYAREFARKKAGQPAGEPPLAGKIHWTIADGIYHGMTLTPKNLSEWIESGKLLEGTLLEHSTRGLHKLVHRDGRAGLTPELLSTTTPDITEPQD